MKAGCSPERFMVKHQHCRVLNKLIEMLSYVLSWKKEQLEKFQSKKSTMTREEFERDLER